ncbi:hypothetical protein CY34DRAFT_426122 [Suillus luteus UH-Slu-Lm8-n1]|uniref:C2H2-type domain-containing protein n=1 Tax=Suillus luteus UH-Slu-Lm8-n1 TaxID=930992 RepID=A0A0D0B1H4_9AGAM|nr:hypothetical protein CY34DRAFT_426122 [Suillus luteus UH-Slu-Lm8-n1]
MALNTPDDVPDSHNFDVASQRNKAPRPRKYQFKPYPTRGTQDFSHHGAEPQSQLLPQLPTTIYPPDLYINKNLVPSGLAPKADYGTTSTFGAGGILGPQSMQMTIEPASVAPLTNAPVMQVQLPTLPEEATHWPAFHSLNDLQAMIMPQNPPTFSMVQHTKCKVVDTDRKEKQSDIPPDEDPEFQLVTKNGEKLYRCLKCVDVFLKENSVGRHKLTNKHQKGKNRSSWLCVACGDCFSRSDALKRHVDSDKQCSRNQKKSHGFAAANLATSNFAVPPPAILPQGTGPAAQQAPSSFVFESNFSSGPAVQPAIQAPRPNSMTHEVQPFAEDIIPPEAPPDVRFSAQAPDEQHSTTTPQPSGVPLLPIVAEGGIDLFGSPISVAPASQVYSESALDSLVLAPSSRFAAAEANWAKILEQLVHESPNDSTY